ncbi:signal peptidase II [Roseiterribacter gracilis]|uniref:Lipoprotein signal peptidase n=1 Tax=Roseiterribacter gracilis TaxID=2812848 RepID=A0A8S8XII4_9PROT|nr:lipoprotein signal peptidase [Rhodospirillales bacterium TMPK1]
MITPGRKNLARAMPVMIVVLLLDQVSKILALAALQGIGMIPVVPFFDFQLAWNRGVSFGLFNHGEPLPPWVFVLVSVLIVAALCAWLVRAERIRIALALGAVIGGAIGNAIDRFVHGAVVDFLHFHVGQYSWPNFNVADSAIVIGVAIIVIDGFGARAPTAEEGSKIT